MKYLSAALLVSFLLSGCIREQKVSQKASASQIMSGLDAKLFMAIVKSDISATKKALSDGANVNARHHQGMFSAAGLMLATPLYFAVSDGNITLVEFLLANGADPLIPNSAGELPIAYAKRRGFSKIITILEPYFPFPDLSNIDRAVYENIQMTCCRKWDMKKMNMDTFKIIPYKNVGEYSIHCDGIADGDLYHYGIRVDKKGNPINSASCKKNPNN